jgi:hypothetical protein
MNTDAPPSEYLVLLLGPENGSPYFAQLLNPTDAVGSVGIESRYSVWK